MGDLVLKPFHGFPIKIVPFYYLAHLFLMYYIRFTQTNELHLILVIEDEILAEEDPDEGDDDPEKDIEEDEEDEEGMY